MNRLNREQTPWTGAVAPAARFCGTDSVADLLKDCARMGLLDELRSTLGLEAKPDQQAALRAVRDLVYELNGEDRAAYGEKVLSELSLRLNDISNCNLLSSRD